MNFSGHDRDRSRNGLDAAKMSRLHRLHQQSIDVEFMSLISSKRDFLFRITIVEFGTIQDKEGQQ